MVDLVPDRQSGRRLAAIERGITELTAQYRLAANYYSIIAESLMF
jgi:hypothetical protein